MIYLDNASTTQHKPQQVIEAVIFGLNNMGNNGRGVNSVSIDTSKTIFEVREKLTDFFNGTDSRRLVFTSNATESLNTVIKGIFSEKDHIITTEMEHNSVLRPLYELESKGAELSFLKREEILDFKESVAEKYIQDNTRAVVCTHASNLTGDTADIEKIGSFCKKHGLLFILDASQSAGILEIDIQKHHIDALCFTGHKSLYGPQGTGGFYVAEGIDVKPLKVGGSGVKTYSRTHPDFMPERLEAGTLNGHGIIGLGAGIDFINEAGIENIYRKELELMWLFYDGIKDIPHIKVYGKFKRNESRVPIVTLNIADVDSSELCDILNTEYGIVTRAGGHCAPLMHKSLKTENQGAVRFSFSYFNTKKETEKAIEALKDISGQV